MVLDREKTSVVGGLIGGGTRIGINEEEHINKSSSSPRLPTMEESENMIVSKNVTLLDTSIVNEWGNIIYPISKHKNN